MKKITWIIIFLLVVVCGGVFLYHADQDAPVADTLAKKERKILYYRNPMDPSVTSPVPIKDSMGMDYIPVYEQKPSAAQQPPGVHVESSQQQLIGIKTGIVQKRDLTLEIRASGRVAFDPDFYVDQTSFLEALKTLKDSEKSPALSLKEQSKSLVETGRRKLYLDGMTDAEIDELAGGGKADDSLYYLNASQRAWVYAALYENEAPMVKPGEKVTFETPAFPGKVFSATVSGVMPVLDTRTRTLQVRVKVDDPGKQLHAEMFGTAKISVDLGRKLSVDQDAVLDTGKRQIVYVVHEGDMFEMRQVTLGEQAKGYYEVVRGLKEGEKIIVSGNFLIDAESRLEGAAKASE